MDRKLVIFDNLYNGKRVLVTGHTGFKGSWLCQWLLDMGAEVTGISLPPDTSPDHFDLLALSSKLKHFECDICDLKKLSRIFSDTEPEIAFHLAAQTIVRRSYRDPEETFRTNLMGTVNVLEAVRRIETVKACVIITSDKCYENRQDQLSQGYRETDPMGGYDPYSASKGCAELAVSSYRNSFFNPEEYGKKHNTLVASARAGNVIGGGDWAEDRLIPDLVRAAGSGEIARIRNPKSVRPWQHVLDPLMGYLMLAKKLFEGDKKFAQAWNFGSDDKAGLSVIDIAKKAQQIWPKIKYEIETNADNPHETSYLKLDSSKANNALKWTSVWSIEKAVTKTIQWYKTYYETGDILTSEDLAAFIRNANDL
ncbi:MAG: CDP-glucose 4,6-dehydratase [Sedimentisphaerales bacterium]|nr:CDP-glucose 4,6-dehydratase [Sedimentisphaerales bacterium]